MRVIICGAGRVGHGIASQLASENNAVTVSYTHLTLPTKA